MKYILTYRKGLITTLIALLLHVPLRAAENYTAVEERIVDTRSRYKEVSATKALRSAQLENRMDLGLRLQLASTVPSER